MSNDTQNQDPKLLVRVITYGVGVLDVMVLLLGTLFPEYIFVALASIGIITFFGVLTFTNTASKDIEFSTGEIRKAITASVLIFYLTSVAYFMSSDTHVSEGVINNIITPFTWLVGSVILFYFGDNALSTFTERYKKPDAD